MADLSRYLTLQPARPPARDLSRYLSSPLPAGDDEERRFRLWYGERARRLGLDADPDNPEHHYDYRAAFRAGAEPGDDGHWPSEFKAPDHPNRFVGGVDTISGKPAGDTSGARAILERLRTGTGAGVPTADIERATGMEMDDPRTVGDLGRRALTAAVGSPAGTVAAREMLLRALLPQGLEEGVVRASVGPERAVLDVAERVTGLPLSQRSQDAAQARFIGAGRSESPVADALADTAAMTLGTIADPTNLIPSGAAVKGVSSAASKVDDLARLASQAERRLQPALRAEVDAILPTLAGKTMPEIRTMYAAADPDSAMAKALERAADQLENASLFRELPAEPKVPPRIATPEENLAAQARYRETIAKKMEQVPGGDALLEHHARVTAQAPAGPPKSSVWRETSIDRALEFLPGSPVMTDTSPRLYFAKTPDLALGQGKNRGVLLEFDSGGLRLETSRQKPGPEFAGNPELIGMNHQAAYMSAVKSVTVKPGAQGERVSTKILRERVLPALEGKGWSRETLPDGAVRLTRPEALDDAANEAALRAYENEERVALRAELEPARQKFEPSDLSAGEVAARLDTAPSWLKHSKNADLLDEWSRGQMSDSVAAQRALTRAGVIRNADDFELTGGEAYIRSGRGLLPDERNPGQHEHAVHLAFSQALDDLARRRGGAARDPGSYFGEVEDAYGRDLDARRMANEQRMSPPPTLRPAMASSEAGFISLSPGAPPPPPPPPLPAEEVAAALGTALPPGSPKAVGPPIITKPFQTNIAAQVGGQEVADYIVQRSDEIAAAIGGPQGWDEVEEMATRLGTTKEDFLAREPRFALMSKEERARLNTVIKGNESDISTLQAKLAEGGATDDEKYNLLRLIDERGALIKLGVGAGSEMGRALNTLKMATRAGLDEATLGRQQLYRTYKAKIDQSTELLDSLARLDPANPDELQSFLRSVDQPKFRDYVQEYWIGSVLSGPATQERNLIGNATNAITENLLVRPARALLDPVVAKVQGRAREHYLSEAPAAAVGMTHGIRKGLARGFEVLRRGYDTAGTGKLLPVRSAFARSQNRLVREVVGPVATGSLRLLSAADTVFKTVNHTAEIYAQAANIARKEGLQGPSFASRVAELADNPTGQMVKQADDFALKATFNDEASNIGKHWMKLRDDIRIPLGKDKNGEPRYVPVGGFLSPFVKIADRLMARGFEYTPVGFAKAAQAAKGTAEVTDLTARASIGSAIMLGAATLAVDDRLTAAAPVDPGERDAFYRSGKKPWSVKMGDDTWVPFGQLQPIATPLALVAASMQAWRDTGEAPPLEKIGEAAHQIGRYTLDQSYMESVGKFFAAVSGGQGVGRAFTDLTTQTASGFVPLSGLTRSIAQAMDPRIVDARTIPQKMKAQLPGLSQEVPARLSVWGEEVTPTAGRLRGVLASGTPLDASRETADPLDQELARLGMPLGFVSNRVMDPVRRVTERLSQDDQYFYQQTAGRKSKELLTALFVDPDYLTADAEAQRTKAENTIGAARQYARFALFTRRHGWGKR